MKSIGITRKPDALGRVVLPMELRRTMKIDDETPLEIFTEEDTIVLRKYEPGCVFCSGLDGLITYRGKRVCAGCRKDL